MYYHVVIETNRKDKKGNYEQVYQFDIRDEDEVDTDITKPYVEQGKIYIDGMLLDYSDIRSLKIKKSQHPIKYYVNIAQQGVPRNVFAVFLPKNIVNGDKYVDDITKEKVKEMEGRLGGRVETVKSNSIENKKVFIVHGHDELLKVEVARLISDLKMEPIILHEKASGGKTIIEKIEEYSDVGFAVVLYTPCDKGANLTEPLDFKFRARQNVVFEHGYLIGKLGRGKVCAIVKGDVETPNDISGVVYVPADKHGAWKYSVAGELLNAGYEIDKNLIN